MKNNKLEELFNFKIQNIYNTYLPSKHSFFLNLSQFPHEKLRSPKLLGNLYLRYQSACHATRVMIYKVPYLESPSLRNRLVRIIADDDNVELLNSHHYQLSRLFAKLGAEILTEDEEFGDLNKLKTILDRKTSLFVSLVQDLYPRSLGAWCVIEMFADNWIQALMDSLTPCFPEIHKEEYFNTCLEQDLEKIHSREALDLTNIVLQNHPELLDSTIDDALVMAKGLNMFWTGLDDLLEKYY